MSLLTPAAAEPALFDCLRLRPASQRVVVAHNDAMECIAEYVLLSFSGDCWYCSYNTVSLLTSALSAISSPIYAMTYIALSSSTDPNLFGVPDNLGLGLF